MPVNFGKIMKQTMTEALEITGKTWTKFNARVCNNGFCDIWAENFRRAVGTKNSELWHTPDSDGGKTNGHDFVKYRGKYYDAETMQGVSDPHQIPYLKRVRQRTGRKAKIERLD